MIPNGVELERFALPRAPVRGRILMVGRLAPPKRPDLALRALAAVRAEIPEAELHVVGDGPLRADAEQLAAQLGVVDAVRFLGYREDVPALLAEAECALLASDYEGCPLAVVEAMAAGVAVGRDRGGGSRRARRAGQDGRSRRARRRGGARLGAAERPGRPGSSLATRCAQGRRVAEERLSLERMVERLTSLYDQVSA